jgi:predicted transcriptional regulator of viral defense system
MTTKSQSTSDKFIESLSPKELKEFKEGYKAFALSELILALKEHDEISVRKLAKIVGVSEQTLEKIISRLKINKGRSRR